MLAACVANGWPLHPYCDPGHPLQRRIAELTGGGDQAVDGCGAPTFAMPLAQMSELFLTTPEQNRAAMTAHPELVGGSGADDTDLMRAKPGWWAKRGAEGLFCAAGDGVAWTFKAEDGASRALRPAIAHVLGVDEFAEVPVRNSRAEVVGAITLAS
jgi:L-asparaginase II